VLCKLPGIDVYLYWFFVSGVPVCCSSLGWCLILRGVGVDSTVLVSIFAVMGLDRSTCVKLGCIFSISYYTCMYVCGVMLYLHL
jgi:hypothetical protein